MAIVDLAKLSKEGPVSLSSISERQEISLSYLEKLFNKLRRAELVKSVRGPMGGYILARSLGNIRISEIVLAVDEEIKATRCSSSLQGCMSKKTRCLVHDLWEGLGDQVYAYLNSISLEDVVLGRELI
jgi:Rrf2 family iron-sulfur cluster assembly transcriptional regulator